MNKIELKSKLESAVAVVTFTKADGSDRVMKCTLQANILPEQKVTSEPVRAKSQDDNLIAVWDVENSGWRSFKLDSIKNIEFA